MSTSHHRSAIAAVGVQFWINGMAYAAIVPRLPDIRDRLDVDVAALGTILTLAAVGGLVGSAASGRVIERLGTKRSIQVGTVCTVAVLPLVGLARTPVALIAVIATLAMLDVVIDIAMNLQGSWLNAERETPIMNRLHGLWSLGTVVGGVIAVRAAGAGVSLAGHLLGVSAVLGLTVAVSSRFLLSSDPQPAPSSEIEEPRSPGLGAGRMVGSVWFMLVVLGGCGGHDGAHHQ